MNSLIHSSNKFYTLQPIGFLNYESYHVILKLEILQGQCPDFLVWIRQTFMIYHLLISPVSSLKMYHHSPSPSPSLTLIWFSQSELLVVCWTDIWLYHLCSRSTLPAWLTLFIPPRFSSGITFLRKCVSCCYYVVK